MPLYMGGGADSLLLRFSEMKPERGGKGGGALQVHMGWEGMVRVVGVSGVVENASRSP